MPIYEYKCRSCGHEFEKIVRHGKTPDCPSCQAAEPERLFSAPGISTSLTRKRALDAGRQKAGKVKTEQDHAQREYERNHIKNHS